MVKAVAKRRLRSNLLNRRFSKCLSLFGEMQRLYKIAAGKKGSSIPEQDFDMTKLEFGSC